MRRIVVVNFERYNPPSRTLTSTARGHKLKWVRWEVDAHRDHDVLDLPPAERWIWPTLVGLAGRGTPLGTVDMTPSQLAREADMTEEQARHALGHLRHRGRIEYATEAPPKP